MQGYIKYLLRKFGFEISSIKKQQILIYKEFTSIEKNVRIDGLHIQIRWKETPRILLFVGKECVVSGTFVFEDKRGTVKIGERTFIGGGLFVCAEDIEIGDDVMISWGCTLIDNDAHSLISSQRKDDVANWKKGLDENKTGFYKNWTKVKKDKITIKNKAWIGFNSIILKGVTIGEGAIVGAGSIVTKNVPDYAIVAGSPATIIRYTE